MIDETKKFKNILDKLPYISEAEKTIACSLYIVSDESKRKEMVEFYQNQIMEHEKYLKEYQDKVDAAREVLKQKIFDSKV